MSAIAASSPPPSYALKAQIQSWSSDVITFSSFWARSPDDIRGAKVHHSPHSLSQSQPLKETQPSLVNSIMTRNGVYACLSDHNRSWERNPYPRSTACRPEQQSRCPDLNYLAQKYLVRRFGKLWNLLVLQKQCSNFGLSPPPLLIFWWFLKPKVVFNPPETKLHCMSSQLNNMYDNAIA